ncbi:MAG: hypothetical protein P4M11_07645, partial [Candidatus Pacebacteria bacterium]|nr:hypothetical protein [Candidatus Paceibacterota bacterium]
PKPQNPKTPKPHGVVAIIVPRNGSENAVTGYNPPIINLHEQFIAAGYRRNAERRLLQRDARRDLRSRSLQPILYGHDRAHSQDKEQVLAEVDVLLPVSLQHPPCR